MRLKMKLYSKALILALLINLSPVPALCQQIPDSLSAYLKIAAKNNPSVLQKFSEYEAALRKIPQAGSLPDPQLDLGVFVTPMELIGGRQVADLKLMQMLPWFGVLKNARDEMSLMAMAKYELFRDSKLQVYYDIQRTWYELFRLRKEISISEKNVEILRVIEQLSLIRYTAPSSGNSGSSSAQTGTSAQGSSSQSSNTGSDMQTMGSSPKGLSASYSAQGTATMQPGSMGASSGSSGLTDLYRIKIEYGELNNNLELLKSQEKTVMARFNSYLDRPPQTKIYTDYTVLPDTAAPDLLSVSDSVRNNPMLNMLSYEKKAYLARKKMVNGMGYPMVGFGLNYSIIGKSDMSTTSMNGKDMVMPMLSVTLPVYRKKYTAMREEAELLSKSSSQNYQAVSNALTAEYYSAVQLYSDALRRVKLYGDQYTLASKSLEIMLKGFSSSTVSLTDVLRIRQQTLDYELKQVEAVTDLNTARAWLNRLMASSENHKNEIQ
jgi:outer membrane protein TolC